MTNTSTKNEEEFQNQVEAVEIILIHHIRQCVNDYGTEATLSALDWFKLKLINLHCYEIKDKARKDGIDV